LASRGLQPIFTGTGKEFRDVTITIVCACAQHNHVSAEELEIARCGKCGLLLLPARDSEEESATGTEPRLAPA
jgi:hypothetical protein